jgi:glycosyltransferase involved in cell wall biosynthesis
MKTGDKKILVDLSAAQLNNSGIPLDSKWLFVDLLKEKELNVSGFIYPLDWKNYNFAVKSNKPDILTYSTYLTFFDKDPIQSDNAMLIMRLKERIKRYFKTYFKGKFRLWLKDTRLFNDTIFRIFFSSGVNLEDKSLIDNADFYITDFFKETVYSRFTKNKKFLTPFLNTDGFDFIVNQDSIPIKVSKGTTQIIRYHDSIPLLNPDLTNSSFYTSIFHYKATKECIKNGAHYVCNSTATAQTLSNLFPEIGERVHVIPYSIPSSYKHIENSVKLFEIIKTKRFSDQEFDYRVWDEQLKDYSQGNNKLLFISNVSTIEPRKNQVTLLKAYVEAKSILKKEGKDLKVILVGSLGWKNEKILNYLKSLINTGDALLLENIHPEELKYIYSHSQAFIFPSYSEGFGLPPVEAMRCGTPVISSDIPVHREVQGNSSFYVNPYNINEITESIINIVQNRDSKEIKDRIKKGIKRSQLYQREKNIKLWIELFEAIQNKKGHK